MADFTQDLQVCLSWGSIAEIFHSLQSLSVSCFPAILGLPGPRFPSTCVWKAVLTAPMERFTCPDPQCQVALEAHQTWWWQCLVAWHCRSVWSLPCHSAADVGGLALSMAKSHWPGALPSAHKSFTHGHSVLKERWREARTGTSSLNFFQAVFTCCGFKVHSHRLLRACLLGSKRKLPPATCRV